MRSDGETACAKEEGSDRRVELFVRGQTLGYEREERGEGR